MNQLTIDSFIPTPERLEAKLMMTQDEIEDRITELFQTLRSDRQEAVLEELTQIWDLNVEEEEDDDDGIEVEIIDDDDNA